MIETVAVIGAGTIGSSWVSYFLSRGCKVKVWDPADSFEKRTKSFITSVWPIPVSYTHLTLPTICSV